MPLLNPPIITDYRNAVYIDATSQVVDLEILTDQYGWIPTTINLADGDTQNHIQQVKNWIINNTASISAYVPNINLIKEDKIGEVKAEAFNRIVEIFPGISSFEELELLKSFWLSIAPAARAATTEFQNIIDIYTAGKNAVVYVNSLNTIAEIEAYNVITDPTWPV